MLKNESTSTPEKRIQGKKKRPIEQHQDGAKRAKVEENGEKVKECDDVTDNFVEGSL